MATLQSVFIPATATPVKIAALGAGTASSIQTFAKYALVAIQATGTINVTFCNASNPATVTTNNGWLIQGGAVAEFELGSQWDSMVIWNPTASSVDVYILSLSRM